MAKIELIDTEKRKRDRAKERELPKSVAQRARIEELRVLVCALIPCPTCEAPIDSRCVGPEGQPRTQLHTDRMKQGKTVMKATLDRRAFRSATRRQGLLGQ